LAYLAANTEMMSTHCFKGGKANETGSK
jgi:hypothetical protein